MNQCECALCQVDLWPDRIIGLPPDRKVSLMLADPVRYFDQVRSERWAQVWQERRSGRWAS